MGLLHNASIRIAAHAKFLQVVLFFVYDLSSKYAGLLLRPIGLYPENSCFLSKRFRASHLRSAPGYRCNELTILIKGNTNNFPLPPPSPRLPLSNMDCAPAMCNKTRSAREEASGFSSARPADALFWRPPKGLVVCILCIWGLSVDLGHAHTTSQVKSLIRSIIRLSFDWYFLPSLV